ncbi:hypothetical protein LO762_15890 [Actinocorallia sp. API 0066]|uniref:hypothetical protein n=1 Tax=Actinocorallia sp. API 0066 TaxID=2896846 RepID=UPI001E2E0B77|nr:hypothetical protein [Actinocorallia sp. API 0066]MCD0450659.1 hypothetical protein [Actinocorallia sp. API 0066]
MVRGFTRRFDPERPRDAAAEQQDAHLPPPTVPIPRAPSGSALVLPGGRPHSLYHCRHDCDVLIADSHLTELCAQDPRIHVAKIDTLRSCEDRVACPLCLPTETDYTKIKRCSVTTPTGPREALLTLWRRAPDSTWHAVVMYTLNSRLTAHPHPATSLNPLPTRR